MGQEVTVKGKKLIREMLFDNLPQIQTALQKNMDPKYFCSTAMALLNGNAKLLNCNQESLFLAIMQSARLGLHLDGFLGQAYLVPYGGRVVMVPGYKGLTDLALRSGKYRDVRARVVYKKDTFEISLGTDEFIKHIPFEGDEGGMRGCYAVALCVDKTPIFEFMFEGAIWKHGKQYSPTYNKKTKKFFPDSIWTTNPPAAFRKTLIRRLCGRLQLSPEAQTVLAREAKMEAGLELSPEDLGEVIDLEATAGQGEDEKPKQKPPGNLEEALDSKTGDTGLNPEELEQAGKYQDLQLAIADHLEGLYPGNETLKETQFNAWASKVTGKKGKYNPAQVRLPDLEKIWALIQEGG